MDSTILIDYTERVYGYAIKHTYNREEADDLSQEILLVALRQLHTIKDECRFEPWLWGVAANVTRDFSRKLGKQRAMFVFDTLETLASEDEYSFVDEQLADIMRTKITQLSKIYRDIVVFHYYDNLSVKEIAEKLGIPEGTVTWRLSESRRKLKKECIEMTETALKPISIIIRISGNGNYNGEDRPFPWVYVNDALSQNILYHCVAQAKTVEELSKLCGVPAYFIEDSLNNLLKREALTEPIKGKYITDFIIYNEEHTQKYNEKVAALIDDIIDEFVSLIIAFTKKILGEGVYTAGKNEDELCYLFGIMALEYLNKFYNPFSNVPYKVRYDGNKWSYHAHLSGTQVPGRMGIERSMNLGSQGTYSHYSYHFGGFAYRRMMFDTKINICEKLLYNQTLTESEKEWAAEMIKDSYLSSDNGCIKVNIPAFNLQQKRKFDSIAAEHFRDFMPKYAAVIKQFTEGGRNMFPKHLSDEVDRAFYFLFVSFFTNVALSAQIKGLLPRPAEHSVCDVLVKFKE